MGHNQHSNYIYISLDVFSNRSANSGSTLTQHVPCWECKIRLLFWWIIANNCVVCCAVFCVPCGYKVDLWIKEYYITNWLKKLKQYSFIHLVLTLRKIIKLTSIKWQLLIYVVVPKSYNPVSFSNNSNYVINKINSSCIMSLSKLKVIIGRRFPWIWSSLCVNTYNIKKGLVRSFNLIT